MQKEIVTVLISQEHLPLIKDWCEHHLNQGWNRITIYDNCGSRSSTRSTTVYRMGHPQTNKISKNGIPYPTSSRFLTDDDSHQELIEELKDLPVEIIRWNYDINGVIYHNQVEAYVDFIKRKRDSVEWAAFIDADEYLCCGEGCKWDEILEIADKEDIPRIILSGVSFQHRVNMKGSIINRLDLKCIGTQLQSNKNIINLKNVVTADVHWEWKFKHSEKYIIPNIYQFYYKHYNRSNFQYRYVISDRSLKCKISEGINI